MTILVIADDDLLFAKLPDVRADIMISCGDLPDELILRAAQRCRCIQILAVKGNHDSNAEFASPIVNLHRRTHTVFGVTFGGFAGAWKYKPRGHHLYEQNEVEEALRNFPHVDVFVAHNSPRFTHDRDDDVHLGFQAFVPYIENERPRFFLHGHQHMNKETSMGLTKVIGTYGHRFIVVEER